MDKETERIFIESIQKAVIPNKDNKAQQKSIPSKKPVRKAERVMSLDLHGLTLEKAMVKVKKTIADFKQRGYQSLQIITGTGKHSETSYPVLFNGINDFLIENSYNLSIEFRKGNGVFEIWPKG